MSVELQVKEAVLMRDRSLGSLMSVVHQVCVVGQSLIVANVLVQRVAIVPCVRHNVELDISI